MQRDRRTLIKILHSHESTWRMIDIDDAIDSESLTTLARKDIGQLG